ncbi:hypothetical protein [Microvirga lenta]|uniref:hypothetical protein n=1 Tax=Microvirga lenta TaxID=2881337 RepID=UPI001CFE1A39|nr:hypothetical protein [Microvirga lenta]MCB5173678.1 hypothetical protein [Microvirga lenta]
MTAPRTCTRTRKRAPKPRLPLFTGEVISRERLPSPKEIRLHFSVAKCLKDYARRDWQWTHFPAGEVRDEVTGAKLKRMGTKPGWPDFIFVSPEGVFHGLELKREGEGLNDDQEDFHNHAKAQGWKVAVAETFKDAVETLNAWGCLRIKFSEVR